MEITKVGVIGAGAIGAYFLWGMRELPREDICLIAKGERKERLIRNGIIINGERYDYPVKGHPRKRVRWICFWLRPNMVLFLLY